MSKYRGILLVMLIFLCSGCGKNIKRLFDRNTTKLVVNEVNFEYLSAKAKVDFETKNNLSLVANFRMQKDSIIWISLSPGLGVEVARVMITEDSISILDKINKKVEVVNYQSLSKDFDFNINFKLIQSVILGNLIFPYDRERVVKGDHLHVYAQRSGNYQFENFIGAISMKLEKLNVKDDITKNEVSVKYGDFRLVEEEIFPFKITALLEYGKESKTDTKINIEFNKIDIEKKPLKFPFNVPQRYDLE